MIANNLITVSQLQRQYPRVLALLKKKEHLALYRYSRPVAFLVTPVVLENLLDIKAKYEELLARQEIQAYKKAKKTGSLLKAASIDELFE